MLLHSVPPIATAVHAAALAGILVQLRSPERRLA
jgi:hypothetical protein